jgi:hypothetical protein
MGYPAQSIRDFLKNKKKWILKKKLIKMK